MTSIVLHTTSLPNPSQPFLASPLPHLLRTPSGLAILEIQGTLHSPTPIDIHTDTHTDATSTTPIGHLEFPLYSPQNPNDDAKWMKKVYLYVGKNQRLMGEVRKLGKPLGVVGKRTSMGYREVGVEVMRDGEDEMMDAEGQDGGAAEELEIKEVVRYKILFGGRPEPVGE